MIDNKGVLEKVTSTEVRGKVTDKFPVLPMDRRKGKNKEGWTGYKWLLLLTVILVRRST